MPSPSPTDQREREREMSNHWPSCLRFQSQSSEVRSSKVNLRPTGSYVFGSRRSPCTGRRLLLLVGFSRHLVSFLKSFFEDWAFSSPDVRDNLADGFYPRRLPLHRQISRRRLFKRPKSRRCPVSDSILQGKPCGGVGLVVFNSDEPFPPLVGVLLFHLLLFLVGNTLLRW